MATSRSQASVSHGNIVNAAGSGVSVAPGLPRDVMHHFMELMLVAAVLAVLSLLFDVLAVDYRVGFVAPWNLAVNSYALFLEPAAILAVSYALYTVSRRRWVWASFSFMLFLLLLYEVFDPPFAIGAYERTVGFLQWLFS